MGNKLPQSEDKVAPLKTSRTSCLGDKKNARAECRPSGYNRGMVGTNSIYLPVFQRFDCHSCTNCCRNRAVNVSEKDRKRIIAAGWEQRLAGQPLFATYKLGGRQLHHLVMRSDGACIFLDDDNLCRLHKETGAASKPLACRVYPFLPTPGADGVRCDIRMDCPSASANQGRPLSAHSVEIQRIATEANIDRGMTKIPTWPGGRELTADEFMAVAEAFERILLKTAEPLRTRLAAGCRLLDMLYEAKIENVRKLRFLELMNMLTTAAIEGAREGMRDSLGWSASKFPKDQGNLLPFLGSSPSEESVNKLTQSLRTRPAKLFRQWLFLHMLADDPDERAKGQFARWRSSWQRYGHARRFAGAVGRVPKMRPDWPDATFEAVQAVGPAPEEAWESLYRAMRLKLDAHAFAGPGYFGYDLLSGLTALWLMPAVVAWLARLAAVKRGSPEIAAEDALMGLRQAHHTFGISPVFSTVSERMRMRSLARPGIPGGILAAYGP
jgi:lysine-N-methylase